MLLCPVVLLTVLSLAVSEVLVGETFLNNGNRHNRHNYKRQQSISGENDRGVLLDQVISPQHDSSFLNDDSEAVTTAETFELDKPLPIEQVTVPAGGKAYLPCDTRSPGQISGKSMDSSGFFMVMWFKEHQENNLDDQNYEQPAMSSSSVVSTSDEPIFTYDIRRSLAKGLSPPRIWSSPTGFGGRVYFHTDNKEQLLVDHTLVDHLTVDRAMASDTGVYRCRVDFLKAPTRNRLVNLTVIVAPDQPKIYFEYGNSIEKDHPENYQQDSGNLIVIDEGNLTITLICRVSGGWPRPRLTWYHENTVLDSTYHLLVDENYGGRYHKKKNNHNHISNVTINRLVLTNLTRWHPIMSQRQQTMGTSRLTCQASNSIATSGGFSRPSVAAVNGILPPPATTEHTFIRLNLKPTEVQIVSVEEVENNSTNDHQKFTKNESLESEDAVGNKKYTIRAGRIYRAVCHSKGSRPLATIEWFLIKRNQRNKVVQTTKNADVLNASSSMVLLGEKQGSASMFLGDTIADRLGTPTSEMLSNKDEMVETKSVIHFMLRGPKSAIDENYDNESTLVCRAFNPTIKTFDRHYVETKIVLNVQYPPVVELRFGNRMLDTGRIGPGDDVYFECVVQANPSTTIRYSWYHNGIRLKQDAEKRKSDGEDEKVDKRNSRLASRVIQYSQLGSLVLQSVRAAAAGKYACQATNGIEHDNNETKAISNTVRLYVKHVPVCQHFEDMLIVTKKSDTVAAGPMIRCRVGRGHPPTTEYRWTFYPEQGHTAAAHSSSSALVSDKIKFANRPIRELESLLTETAIQGSDSGPSFTFTTSTPVLKSFSSAIAAAASASSNVVNGNFPRGRLECRAVNAMGVQNRPCVYRITDETAINEGIKHFQEIADCRSISRTENLNKAINTTTTYPCEVNSNDNMASAQRKTRFCIICKLNTPILHYNRQRLDYVLQLSKTSKGDGPTTGGITFNITGVNINENNENTEAGYNEMDDGDYYFDPEDEDTNDGGKNDYHLDSKNVAQKVMFIVDDTVKPGTYRGRICNSNGGSVFSIVKGMINVASLAFDEANNNSNDDYNDDDVNADSEESVLGYAWRRATVALFGVFSPSSQQEFDKIHHRKQSHSQWQTASVVLTAILVAIAMALICGICGVIAILYRRQHYNHRTGQSQVYGTSHNDSDDVENESNRKIAVGQQTVDPLLPRLGVGPQEQQPPRRSSWRTEYAVDDASNNNHAEASVPLLQLQQQQQQQVQYRLKAEPQVQPPSKYPLLIQYNHSNGATGTVVVRENTSVTDHDRSGPDIVMSTATMPSSSGRSNSNWRQQQSDQMKFNTINGNRQWPLHRLQYSKSNTPITFPRTPLKTSITPTSSVVPGNQCAQANTNKTEVYETLTIPSKMLLNGLHRESSI